MKEMSWTPKGKRERVQAISGDPLQAFALFVLPTLDDPNWIENSRPVSDTGMSSREWAGLVLHAKAIEHATGEKVLVAKTYGTDGDGAIVVGSDREQQGIIVEQTLATYLKHTNVEEGIRERVSAKSNRGAEYSRGNHLLVWVNLEGRIDEEVVAAIVDQGDYDMVNVSGFRDDQDGTRSFISFIFAKGQGREAVHKISIKELKLIELATSFKP